MEVTLDFIQKSFKKFNNEYFDGRLLTPSFEISNTRRALGHFRRRGDFYQISISDYYIRSKKDIETTILHEMIHLYQSQFQCRDRKHGEDFKAKAWEINYKSDYDISRCSSTIGCKVNPKYTEKAKKVRYIMVYKNIRGKYFLFSMATSCMGTWMDYMNRREDVIEYFTFNTSSSEYEHYPSCRTNARGSFITEERYNELKELTKANIHQNWPTDKVAV